VRVCVAYDCDGERVSDVPLDRLESATPVYEELAGWTETLSHARALSDLPEAAAAYVRFIERETSVPVDAVSVGPRRDETVLLREPFD
jgi:adenylosuccinate synthase